MNKKISKTNNIEKIKYLQNTKNVLDEMSEQANNKNEANIKELKTHVDNMRKKYSNKHIDDVKISTMKNGINYINRVKNSNFPVIAMLETANTDYSLNEHAIRDVNTHKKVGEYYTPVKTIYRTN